MALNRRQTVFVEEYLNCWNASEAARRAGYSEKWAASNASKLLKNTEIDAEIQRICDERGVKPPEVLDRLGDQARGSMADFLSINAETGVAYVDLAKAERLGKLHLIRKLSHGRNGLQIELYDAQAALEKLGKALGVLRENVNINQEGQIEVVTRVVRKESNATGA